MVTRWVHPLAFHQYRWWKPVRGGPAWFYGTPRRGPTRGSRVVDLSTVDAPLRSLVGELHDRGYGSIGCLPCTRQSGNGESERAGRWTGFNKVECGIHTFMPKKLDFQI